MSTLRSTARRAVVLALALLLVLPAGSLAAAVELGAATPEELVARINRSAETKDFAELAACLAPEDRASMSLMMILGASMMTAFAQMGAGLAEGMAEMGAEMAEGMTEGLAQAMGDELIGQDEGEASEGEAGAAEPAAEAGVAAEAEAAATAEMAALSAQASDMSARLEALLERHGVVELMEQDSDPAAAGPEAAAALLADVDQVALIADLMSFMSEAFPEAAGEEPTPVPPGELTGLVVEGDTARGRIGEEEVAFVRVDGRWFVDLPNEMAPGAEPAEEPAP
ncbi:MAG TPA: hypothetical protein VF100_11600 [Thermoanaerobaculia bacterium]